MELIGYSMEVKGMTCAECDKAVTEALLSAGARDVHVDRKRERASFRAESAIEPSVFVRAVVHAGYTASEPIPELTNAHLHSARSGDVDLLIIGSGSAGFAAAIRARELGAKVLMVERGVLGGTCVNIGCVPSKALLRSAEIYALLRRHGLDTGQNMASLVAQKDSLVSKLRRLKYADLVEAHGWDVVFGNAQFVGPDQVLVDGRILTASAYLIASGASAWVPPIPGLEAAPYLTSTTALELKEVPRRLAVIGANAIGLELGHYFHMMGSEVILLEVMPRIAPFEEPEASNALHAALVQQGIQIVTGATIKRVEKDAIFAAVNGEERSYSVDRILVATGRRPNTSQLGLDKAGVAVDPRGAIMVDDTLRTSNPKIWAAGDVTGGPQFVYVAAYEGKLAAENIVLGTSRKIDLEVVPRVIFTNPQLAAVGLTEQQARDKGYDVAVSLLSLEHVPRAIVNGQTQGIVKLVMDDSTGQLLGAHVVAENAGDVIYAATLAIKLKATASDLTESFAPYLTMAEGLRLAAQGFERDVARLSCCAG